MLNYYIVNSDLGYKICMEKDWIKKRYDVRWQWNENKNHSRIFFHREDAEGALTILRIKWRTEETSEDKNGGIEGGEVKQSWSEL